MLETTDLWDSWGKRESDRFKIKTHTSKIGNREVIYFFMKTKYSKMKWVSYGRGIKTKKSHDKTDLNI